MYLGGGEGHQFGSLQAPNQRKICTQMYKERDLHKHTCWLVKGEPPVWCSSHTGASLGACI